MSLGEMNSLEKPIANSCRPTNTNVQCVYKNYLFPSEDNQSDRVGYEGD